MISTCCVICQSDKANRLVKLPPMAHTTTLNPMLPVLESGVFDVLAPTR